MAAPSIRPKRPRSRRANTPKTGSFSRAAARYTREPFSLSKNSRTRRVLPMPAAPVTATVCGRADSRTAWCNARNRWSSCSRPTRGARRLTSSSRVEASGTVMAVEEVIAPDHTQIEAGYRVGSTLAIDRSWMPSIVRSVTIAPTSASSHVPLRVPDVALRAEERLAHVGRHQQRGPPLEQLPERGDGEHHRQHEEGEPAARARAGSPQQHLAREKDGKTPSARWPDAIVVVARQIERLASPSCRAGSARRCSSRRRSG